MSFNTVPTVSNGDSWSAAQHNTYLKDNLAAIWVGTTAGDMDYYTSNNAKARLAIGSPFRVLRVNAGGTAPEWAPIFQRTAVYKNSNQAHVNNAIDPIIYNAEYIDEGGWHDNSVNPERITISTTGVYIPIVNWRWVRNIGGSGIFNIRIHILLDGVETANKGSYTFEIDANPKFGITGGVPITITAGSYLTVTFWQGSGQDGNITGGVGTVENVFNVMRIS